MTRLSRLDLREFARVLLLANTPLSLFNGLIHCDAIAKLRKCSPEELVEYYKRVTSRPKQSGVAVALAYAVLTSILLHARDGNRVDFDASRLLWGDEIRNYLERSTVRTDSFLASLPQAKTYATTSVSVNTPVSSGILGPDGLPFRRN